LIPSFSARSLSLLAFTANYSNSFFLSLWFLQGLVLKAGRCEIWGFIYHKRIASTVLQQKGKVGKIAKSCTSRFHTSGYCKTWFSSFAQKQSNFFLHGVLPSPH